jgi:hypothetical protein
MDIKLSLDTEDRRLGFDLLGTTRLNAESSAELPGGARLKFQSIIARKAFGVPETLELVLTFGTGVASGVVANWLYQKLKDRNVKLRIEEYEVELEEGEIKKIISRVIERKE